MSEIDSSPENPKIPENWDFKERDEPGLKVRQIDSDQRFIAFDLPKDPLNADRLEYSKEYFFDHEGSPTVTCYREEGFLTAGVLGTYIELLGDREMSFIISGEHEDFDHEGFPVRSRIAVYFDEIRLFNKTPRREGLAGFVFAGQQLHRVSFEENFAQDPSQKKLIFTPMMDLEVGGVSDKEAWVLEPKVEENEKLQKDWHSRSFEGFDNLRPQQIKNGAIYFDKNGDKIFLIEWKLEEDNLEPNKRQFVVASQTHIPSRIVRVLRTPLRLDMKKVKEAVFARPPYPKDERGRLVVPWRNIDRIVGASLSYSYPPPNPKSS